MTTRAITSVVALALVCLSLPARAQQPPPPTPAPPPAVRPLGPITNLSSDSFASVTAAVQVAGGRVYVNDIIGRRVLLFDSTLTHETVVADSAAGSANAYGPRAGTLLPYRGDSALLITPAALSMLVLSPAGAIARVMAMPPSGGGLPALIGNIFGTPGFDARGRLAYFSPFRLALRNPSAIGSNGPMGIEPPDSAFVVRFDFASRTLDTAAVIRIPRSRTTVIRDDQGHFAISTTAFPPMTVDDWAVTSDGSIAIVRGRDYHVDWLNPDGTWTSSLRMAYAWERMDDSTKTALIDSTATAMQTIMDSMSARMQRGGAGGAGGPVVAGGGGDRGAPPAGGGTFTVIVGGGGGGEAPGRGPGGGGGPTSVTMSRPTVIKAALADVPDYRPAFRQGSVRADMDGNIWIRTNKMVDGRPVYDVVNRNGQVIDRVQLPQFRTIAGFGQGVVYMGVRDSTGVTHLERARVR